MYGITPGILKINPIKISEQPCHEKIAPLNFSGMTLSDQSIHLRVPGIRTWIADFLRGEVNPLNRIGGVGASEDYFDSQKNAKQNGLEIDDDSVAYHVRHIERALRRGHSRTLQLRVNHLLKYLLEHHQRLGLNAETLERDIARLKAVDPQQFHIETEGSKRQKRNLVIDLPSHQKTVSSSEKNRVSNDQTLVRFSGATITRNGIVVKTPSILDRLPGNPFSSAGKLVIADQKSGTGSKATYHHLNHQFIRQRVVEMEEAILKGNRLQFIDALGGLIVELEENAQVLKIKGFPLSRIRSLLSRTADDALNFKRSSPFQRQPNIFKLTIQKSGPKFELPDDPMFYQLWGASR